MPETLHCRFANDDEISAVARLARHSFPATGRTQDAVEQLLRAPRFGGGPETLLVGEYGDQLVGALQLHPLRQWVGGVRLPVAGVGTVAISPAHRRRRFAERLMAAGLLFARERGDAASALYPFRFGFYHRLGYGTAGVAEQWSVSPRSLPDAAERTAVEMLEDRAALDEAHALHTDWIRTQNGQLERTPAMWSALLEQPFRIVAGYRNRDGALEGYVVAGYRTDLPAGDRHLEVDEIVWSTADARRGLYAWLASLADQWERVVIRTLPSHRLQDWISEPRMAGGATPAWQLWTPAATLMMGPMFRLLDLDAAFQRRSIAGNAALRVTLVVDDAFLPDNAGDWTLSLERGRATMTRGDAGDMTLRLGIATLSRVYIGSITTQEALMADLVECDRPELLPALDAALALPEPWLFDRF